MACPSQPYPGLIPDSPGRQFALANVIFFPIFIVGSTAFFFFQRKTTVFLSKRSMPMLVVSGLGFHLLYACTSLYDYLGSGVFNCAWYVFLVYASYPVMAAPLLIKMSQYYSALSCHTLRAELVSVRDAEDISTVGEHQDPLSDPLSGELSFQTLRAQLRVVFCSSRSKHDRIYSAKFSRTTGMPLFWVILTSTPIFIGYFIRLGMNPQWAYCNGCEIETADAAFLLVVPNVNLLLTFGGNPFRTLRSIARRDALGIVRECLLTFWAGGLFLAVGMILFLTDPGNAYASGRFNYRWFMLVTAYVGYYILTIHQVFIARSQRNKVVLGADLDQSTRFAEVMSDKHLRGRLESFLDTELSFEIMRFLNAVDGYKARFQREGAQIRGRNVFETYIISRAPYEVNLSAAVRQDLLNRFPRGNFDLGVFDAAYTEVKNALLDDGFQRFLTKLQKDQSRVVSNSTLSVSRATTS